MGNASDVTLADIPEEFRKDPKILTFISAHMHSKEEKEILLSKVREQIYKLLIGCDLNGLVSIYEKYSRLFGLVDFYEKLLNPVIYSIGDFWARED